MNLRLLFDGGIAPEITPETTSEFSAATEELSKHGHTAIGYRIRYSYQNILDETVEEDKILSSGAAVLEPGQDFEEIYKRSGGRIGTLEPKFFRTEREHVVFFN